MPKPRRHADVSADRFNQGLLVLAGVTLGIYPVLVVAGGRSVGELVILALPISFLAVGWLILRRYPDHVEGRLLLLIGLAWAAALSLPFDGGWVVPVGLMGTHLLLRYPDGALPSPRWRWFARWCTVLIVVLTVVVTTASQVTSQGTANDYFVAWTRPLSVLLVALPVSLLVSVGSVVVRYRRSSALARTQIRWLAAAAIVIVAMYCLALVSSFAYDAQQQFDSTRSNWFEPDYPTWLVALQAAALLSFLLIPAAFGVAILRYHLYDIDRIISRTTSYAVVTGLLLATYAALVATATRLVDAQQPLVVAAATLTVAALARPALRRVQTVVDRRFNRSRYDAVQTVDAFGSRLRQQVDPHHVGEDLLAVVGTTLEPQTVALWMRQPG